MHIIHMLGAKSIVNVFILQTSEITHWLNLIKNTKGPHVTVFCDTHRTLNACCCSTEHVTCVVIHCIFFIVIIPFLFISIYTEK